MQVTQRGKQNIGESGATFFLFLASSRGLLRTKMKGLSKSRPLIIFTRDKEFHVIVLGSEMIISRERPETLKFSPFGMNIQNVCGQISSRSLKTRLEFIWLSG